MNISIITEQLCVALIETIIQQSQLRWLRYIIKIVYDISARKVFEARKAGIRKRGSPRNTWKEKVRKAGEAR